MYGLNGELGDRRVTGLENSLCKHVAANGRDLIITDASKDPLIKDLPVIHMWNLQAYAGIPIWSTDKQALGAFCVLDHRPRIWTKDELSLLREFAAMADVCIEASELRHQVGSAGSS